MKRILEGSEAQQPSKRFRRYSFVDRILNFIQWLPGAADLATSSSNSLLPSSRALTTTCLDSILRCPGCGLYLEAPVKQCVNGHSVCAQCRHQLLHCPTCQKMFIRTPQPVLDRLLVTTRLPCVYASFGCPVQEVLRNVLHWSLNAISVSRRDENDLADRRRDSHSRHCCYRPTTCCLCDWESPPRIDDRSKPMKTYGEELLGLHVISAHKHHILDLDKEHTLFAWLQLRKLQTPAFLSCGISVDGQVFVFVMHYDTRRKRFFVVLKHVSSLGKSGRGKAKIASTKDRTKNDASSQEDEMCGDVDTDRSDENIPSGRTTPQNGGGASPSVQIDSFERLDNQKVYREEQSHEYCYMMELADEKGVQSVRVVQTAVNKNDALDLILRTARCFNTDIAFIDRLLEPGKGQFIVKLTISRMDSGLEDDIRKTVTSKQQPRAGATDSPPGF